MYGVKVTWLGVALFSALNQVLNLVGMNGSAAITNIGAVVIIVGVILQWLDR